MKFPVFSQLAGNLGSETGSLETPSSTGESRANLTSAAATAYAVVKRKISASGAIEGWWSERGSPERPK